MAKIKDIRNTFSKGSVVFDNNNISIFYIGRDWIIQSMLGKNKEIFMGLLEKSIKFSIRINKGSLIKFNFTSDNYNDKTVFFAPIEEPDDSIGIKEIIKEINPTKEFVDFFNNVDFDDDDAILEKITDWTEKIEEKLKRKVRNIDMIRIWQTLKSKALLFSKENKCNVEIIEQDDITDGSISIQFPEIFTKSIIFSSNNKKSLIELIDTSNEICFEINPNDGYLNLVLLL